MNDKKPLRTEAETETAAAFARIFDECLDTTQIKLENFTVRRQHLKRFLALYEVFKLALPVKGIHRRVRRLSRICSDGLGQN
jgi:hypothetical protein